MPAEAAPSSLTLDITRTENIAVVRCTGKLVAPVTGFFFAEVKPLIAECKQVTLDLTDLVHMDSMGIGTTVRLYVSAKSSGCDFRLINLGKRIRELLGITNLLGVFAIVGEDGVKLP
jgi:anti-sigma B factor antagonist